MQALCREGTPRSPSPKEGLSPNTTYSYYFCPWNLEWVGPRQAHPGNKGSHKHFLPLEKSHLTLRSVKAWGWARRRFSVRAPH